MKRKVFYGWLALVISLLACEPVIAIGKNELLCLLVLIVVLLGPPLYRLFRHIEEFLGYKNKHK